MAGRDPTSHENVPPPLQFSDKYTFKRSSCCLCGGVCVGSFCVCSSCCNPYHVDCIPAEKKRVLSDDLVCVRV